MTEPITNRDLVISRLLDAPREDKGGRTRTPGAPLTGRQLLEKLAKILKVTNGCGLTRPVPVS